jgi:two-component system response regulator MtrA
MSQTIVIADDDDSVRRLVEHKLSAAGYEVHSFVNGREAWDHLAESAPPDLCVLDVMMPGLNGLQVLVRLRDSEGGSDLPVIILSSRGREADVLDGLESGATDYLTKPFSPKELVSRVQLRIGSA